MIPSIKARVVTQVACSRRSDSRFLYFVQFRMSLQSVLSSSELSVHPSSCCRFCGKNVKSSGNKIPRVSLFNVVTNKDLVGFSGKESLVLADIASSFGYELKKEEHLSDISCLTCARNLARSAANIAKLFSGENPKVSGKRPSDCRSSTGETPGAKRGSGQGSEKSTGNSRRSLGLGESSACSPSSDDDLGVSPITDEIASGMNINADQTVVKVSLILKRDILEIIYLSILILFWYFLFDFSQF